MQGVALVELVIAMAVVGVSLIVTMQQMAISYRGHVQENEKLFAYQKAMSILAELQVAVDQGQLVETDEMDALADMEPNPILTTRDADGEPLAPDHSMSGNVSRADGTWNWYRRLEIRSVKGNPTMRYARVQIMRQDSHGKLLVEASAGGLLSLPSEASPVVKDYDVYVLAIAAAPSLWMPLPSLRSMIEAESDSIAQDNPGLSFRLHWISKFGYGRDALYLPCVNEKTAADAFAPSAYWYPGKLAAGASASNLYVPELFSGRVKTEEGVLNGYSEDNPHPHAIADQFNHCMRTPAARSLFERRVAAGLEWADEPPLQLLLADMVANPDQYRNAIVVNLHGEGLPFPPLRNYSDPAKSPSTHPGVRVVTHPARLCTRRDAGDDDDDDDGDDGDDDDDGRNLELRVYTYKTDPATGPDYLDGAITIQIMGYDLTGAINSSSGGETLEVCRMSPDYEGFDDDRAPAYGTVGAGEQAYEAGFVSQPVPYTWIRLYNSRLGAPQNGDEGLDPKHRLYGMDYIPSPVEAGGGFRDLSSDDDGLKNTARWRIRIRRRAMVTALSRDRMLTIKTRIGATIPTGASGDPHNESVTYAWWASSPTAVPLTERYQLMGDPRHNPYADVAADHGYNWFFDDLKSGSVDAAMSWPCLDGARLHDGFGQGMVVDVPRMLKIWRDALQSSGAVFTHANGRFANYLLLGGEIAMPRSNETMRPVPVQLNGTFFSARAVADVDTVSSGTGSGAGPRRGRTVVMNRSRSFWAKPWLGELAPDSAYASYGTVGNLPCSGSTECFHRVGRSVAVLADLPSGTDFAHASGSELGDFGPATLLQDSAGKRFQHVRQSGSNPLGLSAAGRVLLDAVGGRDLSPMPSRVPFRRDTVLPEELPHVLFAADYPQQLISSVEMLTEDGGLTRGAGVLRVATPDRRLTAWFVIATDTPDTDEQHRVLAAKTLLWGLRGFHTAGASGAIEQVPQVEIVTPAPNTELHEPTTQELVWKSPFKRFDGKTPFTAEYPSTYEGDESKLVYVLTYSRDGEAFRYLFDDDVAELGVLPQRSSMYTFDVAYGDETYLLELPESRFPTGKYVFRVECFHTDPRCHSSHHEVVIHIWR